MDRMSAAAFIDELKARGDDCEQDLAQLVRRVEVKRGNWVPSAVSWIVELFRQTPVQRATQG